MKIQHPKVASALRTVQHLMRQKTPEDQVAAHWAVPSELAENMTFGLSRAELDALRAAERALVADQAFEHIGDGIDKKVWAFASRCAIDKQPNFVPLFVAENAREVE